MIKEGNWFEVSLRVKMCLSAQVGPEIPVS